MSKSKWFISLLWLSLIGCFMPTSYANNAPITVYGGSTFPINEKDIKMESEVIKIHINKDNSSKNEIEVIFNYYNTGEEKDIEIGFPSYTAISYTSEPISIFNFQASSYPDLTPFNVEKKEFVNNLKDKKYDFDVIFQWKMHFNKGERRSELVKYNDTYNLNNYFNIPATYVLVTGALWKDTIDKIDVYVDFPKPLALPEIIATPSNYYYNGTGIQWHFRNIKPDFNLKIATSSFPSFFDNKITADMYKPVQMNSNNNYIFDKGFHPIIIQRHITVIIQKTGI